jgi:hypothetical protein
LDPCHMLKLARNALGHLGSIVDCENNWSMQWGKLKYAMRKML